MTNPEPSDQESPGTTTRRQFVGAAAMLAASPHIDPEDFVEISDGDPLGFPVESSKNAAKQILLTQDLSINFPQGRASFSDTKSGQAGVFARSDPTDGKVKVHTTSRDEEHDSKAELYLHFEPEDAEFFASVLLELARRARDEQAWRYP